MELNETPEEQHFREELRAWLARYVPEVQGQNEPGAISNSQGEYARRKRFDQLLYQHGWAGLTWPKEYGGRAGRLYEQLIFAEEAASAGAPEIFNRLAIGIVGPTLMRFGTPKQKARYLPKMLSSEEIWCQGFSEPNAGSDLAQLSTRATRSGNHFDVNGQKIWTTLGQYADYCFLLARTSLDKPRHRGITALMVNMKQDGVEVRPIPQINGSHEFNEVFFTDVLVPEDNVIGEVDGGWEVAMTALSFERSTNFITRQVRLTWELDQLLNYAREHRREMTAGLLEELLQITISVTSLRLAVLRHIAALEDGRIPGPENNASKIFWSETHQRLTSLALSILGEKAFVLGDGRVTPDWAYAYLSSRAESIYAGTNEILRNIIAERGLGLPR